MDNIELITQQAIDTITNTRDVATLEQHRVHYLGKKGIITEFLKQLKNTPPAEKPRLGAVINQMRETIKNTLKERAEHLEKQALEESLDKEKIDITLPGRGQHKGTTHPITQTIDRITGYFQKIGFTCEKGPEIENEYYNFEALNIPAHHPARAMHDTFYLGTNNVLRTHTSPVQVRIMETTTPPLSIICPGKVYRCDSDQTHSPMFHQIEGLSIGENISFVDLKTLLINFLHFFFENDDLEIRIRPSYFPFTEPSAEIDIEWGKKPDGSIKWLEVLGCGLVHPKVFNYSGINSEKYTGYAFGLGVERFAMLRYGVDDLRLFFENDMRFLNQFN